MPVDVERLVEIELFALLDPEDRQELADVVDYIKLDAGEICFETGEPGDSIMMVLSGAVELSVRDTVGQKIILTVAEHGDLFGELSLVESGPRTATAVAAEPSEVIVLDRGDLLLFFKKNPDAALHMLAAMSSITRKADDLLRTRVSRNVNEEIEVHLTMVERIADWIAVFSGSMTFLTLNALWFMGWIMINTLPLGITQFDPFPFGLLTMIVSLEAIFLSIFVLISQNRQTVKDRVRSDIEYDINVKAEMEVAHLHEKTDRIFETLLERMTRLEKLIATSE
jgi:CRP/FNR family cyclic AMP-dependent transcriptional regulator